jgi:hypothetical protein
MIALCKLSYIRVHFMLKDYAFHAASLRLRWNGNLSTAATFETQVGVETIGVESGRTTFTNFLNNSRTRTSDRCQLLLLVSDEDTY